MKYYLIAGEASGDLHGSNLIRALREEDPEAEFRAWGGDLMEQAGAELVKHYRDLAFMGFAEVVANLRTILGNIAFCKKDIASWRPDVVILIDYPGFNLRIAKWTHQKGIQTFYYISPQVWAWHASRVKQIRDCVDRMYVILPFEEPFYLDRDVEVDFVGHPLLDVIPDFRPAPDFHDRNGLSDLPVIALLPGSRRQEIRRMLGVMLTVVPHFPDYQFVIAGAPSIPTEFYQEHIGERQDRVGLVQNETYSLLSHAKAALVTSGTATLETALFGVPEIVCYRGNTLSYLIARRLVDVPFISLVNLIAEKELVKELIQYDLTPDRLREELNRLLDPKVRERLRQDYAELRRKLGDQGASRKAARLMVQRLAQEPSG